MTGDETQVHGYNVQTPSRWWHPESLRLKRDGHFDFNRKLHHELLPKSQTNNEEYFLRVACSRAYREKIWSSVITIMNLNVFLLSICQKQHSPYSPCMALNNFFGFPKTKESLKGYTIINRLQIKLSNYSTKSISKKLILLVGGMNLKF